MNHFLYEHTVSLDECNLYGSVYFSHYVAWQGRCREAFLRVHAPELVDPSSPVVLATVHTDCDYLRALRPFDRVLIGMQLDDLRQNRLSMGFEYRRGRDSELVARGHQTVATLVRVGTSLEACPIPRALLQALEGYGAGSFAAAAQNGGGLT